MLDGVFDVVHSLSWSDLLSARSALRTIVLRGDELIGRIHAGTKSNVISDRAVLEINVRTYDDGVRTTVLDAIRRIVIAECQASGCPCEPDIEMSDRIPATVNDEATTDRVINAFTEFFGDQFVPIPPITASEDFGDIPNALGAPYTYWLFGGADPAALGEAEARGSMAADIPVNHSPRYAPVIQPTLDTGTAALVAAALSWLAR